MAQLADPALPLRWQELISQQPESGMTISAFCKFHRISTASFYLWRRKLKDRQLNSEDRFLRVEVVRDQDSETPFRVHLPGGAMVEIPSQQQHVLLGVVEQLQQASQPLQTQERRA